MTIIVEVILIFTDTRTCPIDITTCQPLNMSEVVGFNLGLVGFSERQSDFTAIDSHRSITAYMAIHTTTIDGAKDLSVAAFDDNLCLVGITNEELWTVEITWRFRYVWCRLTAAASKDVTVRQACCRIPRIHTIRRIAFVNIANSTTSNLHLTLTAVQEGLTILIVAVPQIVTSRELFTISGCRVIIRATSIVTLTHRAHITTAINITNYATTFHEDFCVTKHLSRCDTINSSFIVIVIIGRTRRLANLQLSGIELSLTTTASVDGVTHQTVLQGQFGITHDVTVLGTAINSTSDTITISLISLWGSSTRGIIDIYLRRSNVGTEDIIIVVARKALAAATHITIVGINIAITLFEADTSTCDVDFRCSWVNRKISKLVRPT